MAGSSQTVPVQCKDVSYGRVLCPIVDVPVSLDSLQPSYHSPVSVLALRGSVGRIWTRLYRVEHSRFGEA